MTTEWDDVLVRAGFAASDEEPVAWEDFPVPHTLDLDAVIADLTVTAPLLDDDDVLLGPRARRTRTEEIDPDPGGSSEAELDDTDADRPADVALADERTETDRSRAEVGFDRPTGLEVDATVDPWALDEEELPEEVEDSIELELSEIELPDQP